MREKRRAPARCHFSVIWHFQQIRTLRGIFVVNLSR
jgi:hypothetical protein